jgi:trans-aconitate methyltransferase
MSYDPNEYWIEHGKTYKQQFRYNKKFELQEKMLIDYLKGVIPPFCTVLELGCGFGRITKLMLLNFPSITEYTAVDLSHDQIENAKEYVKYPTFSKGKVDLRFIVSNIQSLEMENKYDLVIASEVLLHILPSEIKYVMQKMVNMSNRHVINIDWYEQHQDTKKAAAHNFIHEYEKAYKGIHLVKDVRRIPIVKKGLLAKIDVKQSIFHALLKEDS